MVRGIGRARQCLVRLQRLALFTSAFGRNPAVPPEIDCLAIPYPRPGNEQSTKKVLYTFAAPYAFIKMSTKSWLCDVYETYALINCSGYGFSQRRSQGSFGEAHREKIHLILTFMQQSPQTRRNLRTKPLVSAQCTFALQRRLLCLSMLLVVLPSPCCLPPL